MKRRELEKMVYEKYPVTKKEQDCHEEKARMEGIRDMMRKRLMTQKTEKVQYDRIK